MDVRLPDGNVIQNVPEGTTKEQLVAKLAAKGYDVSWYKGETKPAPKPQGADYGTTAEELPWYKQLAAGAGGAVTGMGLGLRQLTGINAPSEEEVQEYQRSMQGLRGTGGGLTGEIAANLLPGLGMVGAASKVPMVASRLAAGGLPAAKAIAATGGAIGAAEGAMTPVTEDQSRLGNAAIQGTLGAVAPAVVGGVTKTVQSAKNAVMPYFSKGARQTAAGQMMRDVGGEAAIPALRQAQPGQTVGQAAVGENLPELAALQKVASDLNPKAALDRELMQREARQSALLSFGKTPKELEAAIAKRGTDAEANYAKAFANALNKSGNAELGRVMSDPYVVDVLPEVRKIVAAKQNAGQKVSVGEQLHLIKKQLDAKMSGTPVSKPSDEEFRAIARIQDDLVKYLEANLPGYDIAKAEFAKASKDITEMKIGQKVADILSQPLGAKERGAQLARTVADEIALLKQTGGFTRKELAEQLKPENMAKLKRVVDELDIDARFQEQATRGMRSEKLKDTVGSAVELPHILNNAVVLANNAIRKISGGGKVRTIRELSEIMLDPEMAVKVMEKASKKEQNAIKFLVRAQQTGAIVGPAIMETAE